MALRLREISISLFYLLNFKKVYGAYFCEFNLCDSESYCCGENTCCPKQQTIDLVLYYLGILFIGILAFVLFINGKRLIRYCCKRTSNIRNTAPTDSSTPYIPLTPPGGKL